MRFVLVVVLAACHGGGGPVVAFSSNGPRLGFEASGGVGPLGARVGGTSGSDGRRIYATFDPALLLPLTPQKAGAEWFLGFGGSLGITSSESGLDFAGGAWVSPFLWDDADTCETQTVYSVTIGWRSLAGLREVFIAPKVNALAQCF